MKDIYILLIGFLGLIVFISCSSLKEGKALFETKCKTCHTLEYASGKSKDLKGWEKTTMAMARYSDGFIAEGEARKIAGYLAKTNPK